LVEMGEISACAPAAEQNRQDARAAPAKTRKFALISKIPF
jgi:hypothetical protein